uniref:ceramide synthase 4-like isoform X1 n=2 Tax=Styela clava TaxID=7725 RepID=UPI0019392ED7|nr:ceramide synthase 4-like isoform X1 [Styela clava]
MWKFSEWFWKSSFWLPDGISFDDFEDNEGTSYPKPRDMLFVPCFALAMLLIRYLFERFVALPFAKYNELSDEIKMKSQIPNRTLETFYRKKSVHPTKSNIEELSKRLNMHQSDIRNWFRRRRNNDKPSVQTKFIETSWKFTYYTAIFIYGMSYLWKEPWFWDHAKCWDNFPHQNLDAAIYIHFVIESGYYASLVISAPNDIIRKDFWEQMIHHIATLILIIFSYALNFVRIGALTMVLHDAADLLLQGAKCLAYIQKSKMADFTFLCFAITFLVTRLAIFPFWIIHNAVTSVSIIGPYTANYLFTGLLCILQCLHVYWSLIILKMAKEMMFRKPGEKLSDHRSDEEELSENEKKIT